MTKMRLVALFMGICFLSIVSCKKFVQISPPDTELVTTNVFTDNSLAIAAQTNIYANMSSNSESEAMAVNLGLLSDELTDYNNTNLLSTQYYTNALIPTLSPGPWVNAYNYIYQANAVIGNVQGNGAISPVISQHLIGEAKFIRAFWLFYLTNLYGKVPLATTTDYKVNAVASRSAQTEVYQQIIADCKDAQTLLSSSYMDASDTTVTTTDRTRPNKWAAAALLARVYLYTGDYVDAEAEADSVIGSPLYALNTDLNGVFLVNSTEAIWQLGVNLPTTVNTTDGSVFILISEPTPNGPCCSISSELMSTFESNDLRRTDWVDSFQTNTTPISTYYFPYKYKVRDSSVVVEEVMVFRLAEQFLIRAEARAKQNNTTGAVTDLNVIRNRAGLPSYVGGTDQQSLLTSILHERRVELFTEWGHRWLDLVRTGSADSVMSVVTPTIKGGSWSSTNYQLLFPIPLTDITSDPNLVQNPGY